ncbi:MAG: hypothetical protein ABI723_04600 [Bacteroidia bacterium]
MILETKINTMPILHLDSIMLKGITCMKCDGVLKVTNRKSLTGRIISTVTFGTINAKFYQCEKCRTHYIII